MVYSLGGGGRGGGDQKCGTASPQLGYLMISDGWVLRGKLCSQSLDLFRRPAHIESRGHTGATGPIESSSVLDITFGNFYR